MLKGLILFIVSVFLLQSCDNPQEFEEVMSDSEIQETGNSFTEEELSVINQTLNLPPTPFNYADPELPWHYSGEYASEADNTPDDNTITDFGATLGRVLFYDKELSANRTVSCASCHEQKAAFSDHRKFSVGLNGLRTRRNSMTLINSRYYEAGHFFWDERAETLEEQVLLPIQDPIEMGLDLNELNSRLQQLEYYEVLFNKAFGSTQITSARIAKALSQFTRSIIAVDSKFDRGLIAVGPVENEEEMPDFPNFTDQENLGMDIFFRGRKGATCLYCHGTPQMVNDEAKNNGLALQYTDNGKGEVTGNVSDNALFKVPSLRNIANTAPYMHDGRFATLMDVVNHYSNGVKDHPNLNFRLKDTDDPSPDSNVLRLNLDQEEKKALVAFLHTLTDETILTAERFSDPFID